MNEIQLWLWKIPYEICLFVELILLLLIFLYFKNKICYKNGGYVSKDEIKTLVLHEIIKCVEIFKEEMKYTDVEKKNVVHY